MTVDLIDQAFLRRLADPADLADPGCPDTVAAEPLTSVVVCDGPAPAVDDPVVATLLLACTEQWGRLASHVEAAWAAGERVVAVAGRARGDGVSTVVRGLAHVFHQRGLAMTCRDRGWTDSGDDDCPVLVDGGVWFPPGPVHRGRLARAAFGCHAVVLVRRANRSPCLAHAAALEALGIRVLGEVVTFADTPTHPAPESA